MPYVAPSARSAGEFIDENDWNQDIVGNLNTAFPLGAGAWTPYTPTNNNITLGSGTQVARYTRIGRTIHVHYVLTFGSGTSIITPEIGLPVAANSTGIFAFGSAFCFDTSTSNQYVGIARPQSTVLIRCSTDSGTVTSSSPFTWTTGDILSFTITYEAAS